MNPWLLELTITTPTTANGSLLLASLVKHMDTVITETGYIDASPLLLQGHT